jgi:hypothetical protein
MIGDVIRPHNVTGWRVEVIGQTFLTGAYVLQGHSQPLLMVVPMASQELIDCGFSDTDGPVSESQHWQPIRYVLLQLLGVDLKQLAELLFRPNLSDSLYAVLLSELDDVAVNREIIKRGGFAIHSNFSPHRDVQNLSHGSSQIADAPSCRYKNLIGGVNHPNH